MQDILELTPTEFREKWPDSATRADIVLLDVREHEEWAAARVDEALHIPMGQIPERLDELNRNGTIVCMCHGGVRSRRVAEYLAAQGFEGIFNLTGGIDAWSREIDPNVPRY